MVTNYSHTLTAPGALQAANHHARSSGFGRPVLEQLRQMFCGLHGHDTLLHYEEERMSLRCVSCNHETPGWELNHTPPTVTVRGDARHHMLARPQLVSARRVA
jgi:hypothetical protein